MKIIVQRYFELAFWIVSIVLLGLMNPREVHYSFCLFKFLGLNLCPGCGLGHSISFLIRGDIKSSFAAHPLGIFGLSIIFFRIYKLITLHIFIKTKNVSYACR